MYDGHSACTLSVLVLRTVPEIIDDDDDDDDDVHACV